MQKTMFLFWHCFFQHADPHETSYFTMRKLLFHFLWFGIFQSKTSKKSRQNAKTNFGPQNPPKMPPGSPFWVPKWFRIRVGVTENPKNDPKNEFFGRVISWTLFDMDFDWILGSWARVHTTLLTRMPQNPAAQYIYIYIYIYISMYEYMYIHSDICMYTHIHKYIYIYI